MAKEKKQRSVGEETLALHLRALEIPYEREYRFAAIATGGIGSGVQARLRDARLRDWRFDFAFPQIRLAVEVEGGAGCYGRHQRPEGFHNDLIKYQEALKLGWIVYRVDAKMVRTGVAVNTIQLLVERQLRDAPLFQLEKMNFQLEKSQ